MSCHLPFPTSDGMWSSFMLTAIEPHDELGRLPFEHLAEELIESAARKALKEGIRYLLSLCAEDLH